MSFCRRIREKIVGKIASWNKFKIVIFYHFTFIFSLTRSGIFFRLRERNVYFLGNPVAFYAHTPHLTISSSESLYQIRTPDQGRWTERCWAAWRRWTWRRGSGGCRPKRWPTQGRITPASSPGLHWINSLVWNCLPLIGYLDCHWWMIQRRIGYIPSHDNVGQVERRGWCDRVRGRGRRQQTPRLRRVLLYTTAG